MTNEGLYDIYYLFEAPQATEKNDLMDVIKIVFSMGNSSTEETIAIDVQNNEIYLEPWMSSLGIDTIKGTLKTDNAKEAIDILKKYNVQGWKEDYSYEDPSSYEDGFGWTFILQFEDGTIEEHGGAGSFAVEIIPENLYDFFNELNNFVNERLEDDYK